MSPRWVFALILTGAFLRGSAHAAPIREMHSGQRMVVSAVRIKGQGLLPKGLTVALESPNPLWTYLPGSGVSVPNITIKLLNIPTDRSLSVLIARVAKMTPDPIKGYVVRIPVLKRKDHVLVSFVNPAGAFEEWEIRVDIAEPETNVFVDENCQQFALRIKELKRPAGPNLFFVGCRVGSGPREISLDILWPEIARIQYDGQTFLPQHSVLTLPLKGKTASDTQFSGFHVDGKESVYTIHYEPYIAPPFELWVGLAFFWSNFTQSNYTSSFNQFSSAFISQFWYRPEDIDLSVMGRLFGNALNFSETFTPPVAAADSVRTYFLDVEFRYKLLDQKGWRIDPFLGGWFFFMEVKSRNFGLQRIINPMAGVTINKKIGKRDHIGLTLRLVSLQNFFNPFAFSTQASYFEAELTYAHPLALRNRVFGTLYIGSLNYNPGVEDQAVTRGGYIVFGGGYGW